MSPVSYEMTKKEFKELHKDYEIAEEQWAKYNKLQELLAEWVRDLLIGGTLENIALGNKILALIQEAKR